MSIPFGYLQGNRSEYLAIPALTKLGFVIPVPRQEDHFGVDFVVHLAEMVGNTVHPTGKSFGIQIKSNKKPISFKKKRPRDCLFNSSLPFFLGVVSREDLSLTIYNTLGRICFLWMKGGNRAFELVPNHKGKGLRKPDYDGGKVWTGKPISRISLKDKSSPAERLDEIRVLQTTMNSWINLENQILALKEQEIPIVWWPKKYETNKPLESRNAKPHSFQTVAYVNPTTLPNICRATKVTLYSLSCYLRDYLKKYPKALGDDFRVLVKEQLDDVEEVRKRNQEIISTCLAWFGGQR